jgi:hypothetical protein
MFYENPKGVIICIEKPEYTTPFDSVRVEYYFYLLFLSIFESEGFFLNKFKQALIIKIFLCIFIFLLHLCTVYIKQH